MLYKSDDEKIHASWDIFLFKTSFQNFANFVNARIATSIKPILSCDSKD